MIKKNVQPIEDINEIKKSIAVFKKNINKGNIQKLTLNQYSSSSVLAMTSDWNHFINFCHKRNVSPLPTSHTAVRLFLETEAKKRKFSSIRRYSSSIGLIHKLHGYQDPCSGKQIRLVLATLKLEKSGDARQANAFTEKHINELKQILIKENTPQSIRDLALYYVIFECALKKSEIRNLQTTQIEFVDEDAIISLGENHYRLSNNASVALSHWMSMAPGKGVCFRRIDRHGNIGHDSLDDSSIYRILRRASDKLNLSKELRFTTQSARVGAAKTLEKQGYNLKDIQHFGRWLSPAMPAQYLNKPDIAESETLKFKRIKPWR